MAATRTVRSAVDRIRKVVAAGTGQWSDTEILATLDEVLEKVWTTTNQAGRDHTLDSFDTVTTDAEAPDPDLVSVPDIPGAYEFRPHEYMGPIRTIQWLDRGTTPIPSGNLRLALWMLGNNPQTLGWYRAPGDRVRIHGLLGTTKVRIHFLRRWPPMHFGVAAVPGTVASAQLSATAGRVIARAGWYQGSRIEWTTGNPDALVEVTGNTTPLVVEFYPAMLNTVDAGDQYTMVLPCDPEHADYVIQDTALRLLAGRDGNSPQAQEQRMMVGELREAFIADLAERDMARQRRPFNSRTSR